MVPFKPKRSVPAGTNPVPGGEFPVPPLASALLSSLPPPASFTGPFVVIDKMCEAFVNWTLPEDEKNGEVPAIKENGVELPAEDIVAPPIAAAKEEEEEPTPVVAEEEFQPDYSKLPILDPNLMSGASSTAPHNDRKRRAGSIPSDRQGSQTPQHGRGNESDDDDDVPAPPVKDIYRARQMQKKSR